ncbi:glycosyltransferase family 2 protein [Aquimarina sp. ERC-38]|uniref:glycosyltransferase family 2 protein n=1 Tax=Aquimarina sp. ERC-38 TaxID=2949996 RepID=UPI0022485F00|nr:glycosyltransferase family 2 protein [Aquimarina sp. ERC-38]UZO80724.1 glycosyltransferase family 2 protein [Aquimarina sp. ERC-38]
MNSEITVIIPIYNEEESLPIFLPEVISFCTENNYQLILVNDGSTDTTGKILSDFENVAQVQIITHKVNKGYGGAIKTGILQSLTDLVITIDADGQHYLEDIIKLYKKLLAVDADLVIGSRKGNANATYLRGFGKNILRAVAKLLMNFSIYDINSGMKLYRSDLVKKYLKLTPDTMSFSDIITLIFINNKHLVVEEPILIKKRIMGKSTIGVRTAFETFIEIINIVILFNPAKIFLPIAILLFTSGFIWGIYFFVQGLGISIGGSTLILAGLLIFLLGLIAEQLSAIRKNQ